MYDNNFLSQAHLPNSMFTDHKLLITLPSAESLILELKVVLLRSFSRATHEGRWFSCICFWNFRISSSWKYRTYTHHSTRLTRIIPPNIYKALQRTYTHHSTRPWYLNFRQKQFEVEQDGDLGKIVFYKNFHIENTMFSRTDFLGHTNAKSFTISTFCTLLWVLYLGVFIW